MEEKGNKSNIVSPHDSTFKKLFGQKEIAKDLIMKNLPEEVLGILNLDSLERVDGSFVTEKLQESFSDIIYRVEINNKDAYISLLLEHKSYKDKLTIFQVARYIIELWSRTTEDGQKELPIVIPIVVYHGKGKWNYKTDMRELIADYKDLPKYIKKRLPVLKHEFINISSHGEEKIQEYDPITRLVIRTFKNIFENKDKIIEEFLIAIEEIGNQATDEELYPLIEIILIYYSATNKDLTEEDIVKKIKSLEGKGDRIMTILQEREQKGIEKGMEKGMEKGIEKGLLLGSLKREKEIAREMLMEGETIEKIIRYTGLSQEEIEKLHGDIQH